MASKLKQIMGSGCGVGELETCPKAYHFELTEPEMNLFLKNPNTTAKLMGMEPGISSVQIGSLRDADGGTFPPVYCCVRYADSLLCIAWHQ